MATAMLYEFKKSVNEFYKFSFALSIQVWVQNQFSSNKYNAEGITQWSPGVMSSVSKSNI